MSKLLRDVREFNIWNHIDKREVTKWGTYGKNLDQPLRYVWLKDMSDGHIINCLMNCKLTEEMKELFSMELYLRLNNPEYSIKGDTVKFIEDEPKRNITYSITSISW
jgi:hypothetical protein